MRRFLDRLRFYMIWDVRWGATLALLLSLCALAAPAGMSQDYAIQLSGGIEASNTTLEPFGEFSALIGVVGQTLSVTSFRFRPIEPRGVSVAVIQELEQTLIHNGRYALGARAGGGIAQNSEEVTGLGTVGGVFRIDLGHSLESVTYGQYFYSPIVGGQLRVVSGIRLNFLRPQP